MRLAWAERSQEGRGSPMGEAKRETVRKTLNSGVVVSKGGGTASVDLRVVVHTYNLSTKKAEASLSYIYSKNQR